MSNPPAAATAAASSGASLPVSDPHRPVILWFRDDLRLADNPGLAFAVASDRPVLCIFIHDIETPGLRPLGGAAKWWLAHSLASLSEALKTAGGSLHVFKGRAETVLADIVSATDAASVVWNRRYGAGEQAQDAAIKASLKAGSIQARSFNSHLLNEPWDVRSKAGGPMKVFTPYWRAARERGEPPAALPAPDRLRAYAFSGSGKAAQAAIADLKLVPENPDWAAAFPAHWTPGEMGARASLTAFLASAAKGYTDNRNRPDRRSTSRLSPHLRFGEISPRQVWHATHAALASGETPAREHDLDKFLTEIGWREFSYHLLNQFPALAESNFQHKFNRFPWIDDVSGLKAWQRGRTGYPIVDAGMRELWQTGWMHNRVRMIVGSFLVKHLLIDWRKGEDWFWDTLVDADPASNAASWQWVAGSGADAAPYFRIFAPVLQGEKFDPNGDYVRTYVPELARLPKAFIHKPWLAPHPELMKAGITLGVTYPHPVVVHEDARRRALAAFKSISAEVAD
jgi:deoxyribodipyrimidine photo-lyase